MYLARCGRTRIARGLKERRARSIAAAVAAVSSNLAIVRCAFTPGGKTQSVRSRKFCYILLFSLVMLFTRLVASTTLFRRDGEGGNVFMKRFLSPGAPTVMICYCGVRRLIRIEKTLERGVACWQRMGYLHQGVVFSPLCFLGRAYSVLAVTRLNESFCLL